MQTKLNVEYVKKTEIKPFKNNPRLHSDFQINQIVKSIKEFGFVNPILIDETNTILAGHGRFMAAEKLNYSEIPTVKITDLDEKQKKALVIADNKITLNSVWDTDKLWEQVRELGDSGFDLDILAFDEHEMLPMLDNNVVHDLDDEWENMPEYINDDKTAYKSMIVHFLDENSFKDFQQKIGQDCTEKTKFIWHTKQDRMDTKNRVYE